MTEPLDPWTVLAEHERRVRSLIHRMCPADQRDEAYSEVCVRAPDIVRNYDASKGEVTPHFMRCVHGYVYKFLMKGRGPKKEWKGVQNERPRELSVAEVPDEETHDQAMNFTTASLHEGLDPFDVWLLEARAVDGYSFVEIAEHLGEPPHVVSAWYRQALQAARNLLGEDGL